LIMLFFHLIILFFNETGHRSFACFFTKTFHVLDLLATKNRPQVLACSRCYMSNLLTPPCSDCISLSFSFSADDRLPYLLQWPLGIYVFCVCKHIILK
jgi:hypothetical protein